ncbi:MAG: hypothetical protein N2234_10915, partial [Planctomycetota bacterium]|nr:hypothetical protein [Planctomycetota bacterium]
LIGDDKEWEPDTTQGPSKEQIEQAVKKGVEYLKSKQNADGSWVIPGGGGAGGGIPMNALEGLYPEGTTALVLLALLKSGVKPTAPCIQKGFAYLRPRPFKAVYSVSCLILALAALYAPPEEEVAKEEEGKPDKKIRTEVIKETQEQRIRKRWAAANPIDRKWLEDAVKWLLSKQQTNIWRYPGGSPGGEYPDNAGSGDLAGMEDFSNTQYVMLALYVALRLGVAVPWSVFEKVCDYGIRNQEKDGPEVDWFPVPAADFDISKLKGMEAKVRKELAKALKEEEKETEKGDATKPKTEVIKIDPYKEKQFGAEKKKMKARGWAYLPNNPKEPYCGSMTTSGVAAMVVCKMALEGTDYYKRNLEAINQSIRDGCAWLAHNFTISANPGKTGMWHYYYLYGLERAGVLSLCQYFGKKDWYAEGANYLVRAQGSDGSWPRDGNVSEVSNTC